jgi:hypothetical protein
MTSIIARLVLAMLILPVTCVVFIILFVVVARPLAGQPSLLKLLLMWAILYAFVGSYWTLLWGGTVRWTRQRVLYTALGTALALASGVAMGVTCMLLNEQIPPPLLVIFGGAIVPIIWVTMTVIVWRETPAERTLRLAAAGADSIVCPICGYQMTGLRESRCPECGASFTLEQLVAAQPARAAAAPL